MGVDYVPCAGCGETICDSGDFYICEPCGRWFCLGCFKELAKDFTQVNQITQSGDADENDENAEGYTFENCWYCTDKKSLRRVTDEEFIEWLVKISGKTHEDYLNYLLEQGQIELN